MLQLVFAVIAGGSLLLGACAIIDTVDRIRDRSPYAMISGVATLVLTGCALISLQEFLERLGA